MPSIQIPNIHEVLNVGGTIQIHESIPLCKKPSGQLCNMFINSVMQVKSAENKIL